jgi:tetratricopeptide (TPR) repeat protein
MAKKKTAAAAPQETPQAPDAGQQVIEWIEKRRRPLIGSAAAVAVIALGTWSVIANQKRKEIDATRALNEARVAAQSGNFPLAASDLSRLKATFRGTMAADEAAILLAQVRLLQDQPSLAAEELRAALDGGMEEQFRAPAWGLLGTALEQMGSLAEAGRAYETASGLSWYGYVQAQYLNDAGRVYLDAGDTTSSLAVYERVLEDYADSPGAAEASVRVGELTAAQNAS